MNSVYFHALPRWCRPPLGGADGDDRTERVIASYMRLCQIYGQRNIFEYTHNSYKVVAFAKQSRNPEFIAIAYSKLGLELRHVRAVLARHVLHPLRPEGDGVVPARRSQGNGRGPHRLRHST